MNGFWEGFEKRAGLVDWYKKTKASPSFKAKKIIGTAALATAPVLYGLHRLTKAPDLVDEQPQQQYSSQQMY